MSTDRPPPVRCPGCGYEGATWEHDCTGRRRDAVLRAGLVVGRHWLDQEGVNAQYLDALGETVRLYDAPVAERDRDRQLAQACRDWHRGVLGRDDFLSSVARLADSTECQACRKTLTYEEAKEHVVDCPGPAEDSSEPSLEYRRGYKEGRRATGLEVRARVDLAREVSGLLVERDPSTDRQTFQRDELDPALELARLTLLHAGEKDVWSGPGCRASASRSTQLLDQVCRVVREAQGRFADNDKTLGAALLAFNEIVGLVGTCSRMAGDLPCARDGGCPEHGLHRPGQCVPEEAVSRQPSAVSSGGGSPEAQKPGSSGSGSEPASSSPQPAASPDPLHPTGRCRCGGEGRCAWCKAVPDPYGEGGTR